MTGRLDELNELEIVTLMTKYFLDPLASCYLSNDEQLKII